VCVCVCHPSIHQVSVIRACEGPCLKGQWTHALLVFTGGTTERKNIPRQSTAWLCVGSGSFLVGGLFAMLVLLVCGVCVYFLPFFLPFFLALPPALAACAAPT
jgi:hypothetical protein